MTVRRGCDWKSVLLSTILVVLVAISIAGGTVAAQGEGFSLSPLSFETVLVAGKEDETQMTVKNMGSHPLSLKIYACDVIASAGVDGAVTYVSADDPAALASPWYFAEPALLALAPGEEGIVRIGVAVPADAPNGSYCGVVFAETVPASSAAARVGNRIGMLTYLTVGKESDIPAEIVGVRVRNWWRNTPYLELTVQNSGPVHRGVSGQIEINQADEVRYVLDVPRVILQPNEERKIAVPWGNAPRWGRFALTASLLGDNSAAESVMVGFVLFPAASALGLILLMLSLHFVRGKSPDPMERIKKPGR